MLKHGLFSLISDDRGFLYPSTQCHYRRLILLLTLLYCYMSRSYGHLQAENMLLVRITQLATDPLFYTIANIIMIVFYDVGNPS
jgi:hypothetical protein